jgi:iron complex outermembrane receptor protein
MIVFVCAVVPPATLDAQPAEKTTTISGLVQDVAGRPISGAAVSVRNEAGGALRMATAGADGTFSVTGLGEGSYTVEASASSFSTSRRSGVKLAAGATENVTLALDISELAQSITVEGTVSLAAEAAPSQNTLDARSARSEISPEYIQNFASPIADYTELLNDAPGTFSVNPNGVGLGDSKTYFRGFKDGQYTMQADGIPFNDTNDPTHHSWAFFPSQFIAGVDFDRSPGTAASIGPTNFGGTVNLLSRSVAYTPDIRATASYGSFNTRMLALDLDSGQFGPGKKSSLTINVHQMLSDGYETYNHQKRVAGFLKYQYRINDRTTVTVFGGLVDLWTNTPNLKGPSRAQIAQFGDNYLLSGDPSQPNYYGYNFYHVQTDFEYVGIASDLGHGWKVDNKAYTYRYWNKQNYNNPSIQANGFFLPGPQSITANSAVDKLNGYRKVGEITTISYEMTRGILRAGLWFEWAYTDRYQIPSDPRTWVDAALPNFHEHFITTSAQPFIEYEYRVTSDISVSAGIKAAQYGMDLSQYQDNGKTVGCLGGALSSKTITPATTCIGGLPRTFHEADYRSWMPSADVRYKIKTNWTAYAQFATGSNIPPSSVFDSANALVAVLPKPTSVKTYQVGSVLKFNRWTLDFDAYYSHFQNPYSSLIDATTGEAYFYQTGPSNTRGMEAESNVLIGHGVSVYLNGTLGSAKYQEGRNYANGGLWIANTPKNTEAIGLTYQVKNWDLGIFDKRVGPMYNDNGTINQAVAIYPFHVTNLFFNYTFKGENYLRGTKIRFAINNLFDQHNIVGVVPYSTKSNAPSPGDVLTLLPARSVSVTMTFGYAPKW